MKAKIKESMDDHKGKQRFHEQAFVGSKRGCEYHHHHKEMSEYHRGAFDALRELHDEGIKNAG